MSGQSEGDIMRLIMMELSKAGCIVWRNNVGALKDATGRLIRYGLCEGSSDLIGIAPDGRMIAMEVKRPGKKPTPAQCMFIDAVRRKGGIAGVATSAAEALHILNGGICSY